MRLLTIPLALSYGYLLRSYASGLTKVGKCMPRAGLDRGLPPDVQNYDDWLASQRAILYPSCSCYLRNSAYYDVLRCRTVNHSSSSCRHLARSFNTSIAVSSVCGQAMIRTYVVAESTLIFFRLGRKHFSSRIMGCSATAQLMTDSAAGYVR